MCNWILLARTQALFGDSKVVNYGLVIYFLITYSITGVLVGQTSYALVGEIFYSRTIYVCGIAIRPPTMGFIWVAPMAFETITFVLSTYKLYEKAIRSQTNSSLLPVLYRDGVCHYLAIIGLRIFNLMAWMFMPTPFLLIGVFLLWAVISIATTRLQINILTAVDPTRHISLSQPYLPGLRRNTTLHSQHTHLSRRFSSQIQLHGFRDSLQPTQIRIETSIHRITVPDDERNDIVASSAAQSFHEEKISTSTLNLVW